MSSQFSEDLYIAEALSQRPAKTRNDRYLDIGAWHPVTFSNTRALYEKGWSGVMIEPSPLPMEKLLREYGNDPRIVLINAAVGLDPSLTLLHVTEDALSTTSAGHAQAWRHQGGYYGSMFVPQITLAELFEAIPANFGFVNIDTEGSSFELLKEMFRLGVHPWCVCFEHDGRYPESFAVIHENGYKVIYENDCNRVLQLRG
jgi:FkbM family methyltransferase